MTTQTQPKFTPGPWSRLPEIDDETGEPTGRLGLTIQGPEYVQQFGNEQIPGVHDTVCVLGFSAHLRHDANAHLIAAAPEMYEALVMAMDRAALDFSDEQIDQLDAAIAKAEGRRP